MLKKIIILILMILYLYFHTFNIFLNRYIFLPSPLLFGLPLVVLFREKIKSYLYVKEVGFLLLANFFYYFLAQEDIQSFFINSIVIVTSSLYFNYFVGNNKWRFNTSIYIFYGLLTFSSIIMFLNHLYPERIDILRSQLVGGEILQSPSGITSAIYNFGYQLATLVGFVFINTLAFKRNFIVKLLVLILCLITIYFGMQRSVLFTFSCTVLLFSLAYYKLRAIPFILGIALISVVFSMFFLKENSGNYDNIFAKNERNSEEDRGGLVTENLKIYAQYPYGLMFHGKTWHEVSKNHRAFNGGITSHNAYLMFFTYLGPFLGIFLLVLVYHKIGSIFKFTLGHITDRRNAMLVCLCFSFLSASLNSLFHNSWFVGANGSLIFVYFAILQIRQRQLLEEADAVEILPRSKNVEVSSPVRKPVHRLPKTLHLR
jgi:hypothetical protein